MFENVGEKIKAVAFFSFVFDIIGSVIAGIYVMYLSLVANTPVLFVIGFFVIGDGILVSYIVSIFLYGFGELITTNKTISEKIIQEDVDTVGMLTSEEQSNDIKPNCEKKKCKAKNGVSNKHETIRTILVLIYIVLFVLIVLIGSLSQ